VFFGACAWVLARVRWEEIDPADPGKRLVSEIVRTMQGKISGVFGALRRKDG
jgi:hypothetical protein